jgi:hypothetical protein
VADVGVVTRTAAVEVVDEPGAGISVPNDAEALLKARQSIFRECSVMLPRAFLKAAAISAPVAKRFSRSFSSAFITIADTASGMANSGFAK